MRFKPFHAWPVKLLLAACFVLSLQGCSYKDWYEGFKEQRRQDCYRKYPGEGNIQACLDKANSLSYEEYKREREKSLPSN